MLRRFDIGSPEKWLSELRGFQINARTGVRLTGARRPLPFVNRARGGLDTALRAYSTR
jgi:hypothetical protein